MANPIINSKQKQIRIQEDMIKGTLSILKDDVFFIQKLSNKRLDWSLCFTEKNLAKILIIYLDKFRSTTNKSVDLPVIDNVQRFQNIMTLRRNQNHSIEKFHF